MRAVSLPVPSRASDRKDSTPRHGRLLHPSSWAERDDRDHAAENFFQGGSPKQATPLTGCVTPNGLPNYDRCTEGIRRGGVARSPETAISALGLEYAVGTVGCEWCEQVAHRWGIAALAHGLVSYAFPRLRSKSRTTGRCPYANPSVSGFSVHG